MAQRTRGTRHEILDIPKIGWRRSPVAEESIFKSTGFRTRAFVCEPKPDVSFVVSMTALGFPVATVQIRHQSAELPAECARDLWRYALACEVV